MIVLTRVDDRLLHGQVAFSWLSAVNTKTILIANDQYANNPMLKMSLMIGKPPGVELSVVTKKQAIAELQKQTTNKIMLILQNIPDMFEVAKAASLTEICIGGVRDGEGKKLVYNSVYLNDDEMHMIKELITSGVHVYMQDVPISKKLENEEILTKYKESR